MNVMTNFTTKSLRANKARTIVTIIGVALAAALLTAVLTSYTSLTDFLYRSEAATSGTWMAKVEAEDASTLASELTVARGKKLYDLIRLTISIAPVAQSKPLLPAFVPARSMACSIVSVVTMPNMTGTPVSSETCAMPFAASLQTRS